MLPHHLLGETQFLAFGMEADVERLPFQTHWVRVTEAFAATFRIRPVISRAVRCDLHEGRSLAAGVAVSLVSFKVSGQLLLPVRWHEETPRYLLEDVLLSELAGVH